MEFNAFWRCPEGTPHNSQPIHLFTTGPES
jgi:hypothetical protein